MAHVLASSQNSIAEIVKFFCFNSSVSALVMLSPPSCSLRGADLSRMRLLWCNTEQISICSCGGRWAAANVSWAECARSQSMPSIASTLCNRFSTTQKVCELLCCWMHTLPRALRLICSVPPPATLAEVCSGLPFVKRWQVCWVDCEMNELEAPLSTMKVILWPLRVPVNSILSEVSTVEMCKLCSRCFAFVVRCNLHGMPCPGNLMSGIPVGGSNQTFKSWLNVDSGVGGVVVLSINSGVPVRYV